MRYIMKGGVWKNSQDQILKAAIMKYGLNQWSRISSLLQRKSAKQCKQRWYQWLDPSIKKTQWSRAEDQKLLQLARVFPSQWRTIAPYVGRTPTQCFERYQKLLDFAQGKTGSQTQDLKRLRPGEIDPNPQTKPARLDPIDMDEDEKQMLAQVRVRLANTKGKKAKRKQRQKIIEQARRLAQLQKIRQLEMAGVDNIPTAKQIKRMRQKQDIDYNKQVPFKREVPQFVYKLQQNQTSKNTFFASTISLQTLQGKRRDVQQQLQRKLDKKRIKRLKDTDYKAMLALKSKFEKPVSAPIQLPQPQLADKDLQDMKKYNITTPLKSLIDNATPFGMTPENKILLSARVNYSLNHVMTPIGERQYGEQNDEQERDQNEQFDGVQKLNYLRQIQRKQKDPNKMRSVQRLISERVKTPLSHNQWEGDRSKVTSLFKNLRKPENIIQFAIEEQQQEQQQNDEQQVVMDAQEQQKYEIEKEKKKAQQRLNSRNMALKLNLQRVKKIPVGFIPLMSNKIESLIQKQMVNMLYSDMIDYPIQMCELPEQHKFEYLSPIPQQKRKQILELIQSEAKKQAEFDIKAYQKKYQLATKHIVKDMKNKKVYTSKKQVKVEELAKQYLYPEVGNLQSYKMHEKAVEQAEKKAKKYLGGYEKLINTKMQDINNLSRQLEKLKMEKRTLQILSHHESMSATKRIEKEEAYYKIIYNSI